MSSIKTNSVVCTVQGTCIVYTVYCIVYRHIRLPSHAAEKPYQDHAGLFLLFFLVLILKKIYLSVSGWGRSGGRGVLEWGGDRVPVSQYGKE